jgi:hypothetical protein
MKNYLFILSLTLICFKAQAQTQLFGKTEKREIRKGWLINLNGTFDVPGGDMAKRFGLSNRVGPAFYYKSSKNWLFGVKCDFIVGTDIREDSLMWNIKDRYGEFLTTNGTRTSLPQYERGYMIGLDAGKIFNFNPNQPDNGILVLSSLGFIQHKINIYDADAVVAQLRGDYLKGFDRLTNGLFYEQYLGYAYFSRSALANFHIGLDAVFAFTQGRRDYQFDLMRPDNKQRLDMLFSIKAGWYIPIYKRKSEEIFY